MGVLFSTGKLISTRYLGRYSGDNSNRREEFLSPRSGRNMINVSHLVIKRPIKFHLFGYYCVIDSLLLTELYAHVNSLFGERDAHGTFIREGISRDSRLHVYCNQQQR